MCAFKNWEDFPASQLLVSEVIWVQNGYNGFLTEPIISTPSNPPSGSMDLYFKTVGEVTSLYSLSHAGVETEIGAGGFTNPMTTLGDIIFENSTPAPDRLGIGSAGQVLTVVSGQPAWADATGGSQTPWTSNINPDGFVLLRSDGNPSFDPYNNRIWSGATEPLIDFNGNGFNSPGGLTAIYGFDANHGYKLVGDGSGLTGIPLADGGVFYDTTGTYPFIDYTGTQNLDANISFAPGYTYISNSAGQTLMEFYPAGVVIPNGSNFSMENIVSGIMVNAMEGYVGVIDPSSNAGCIPYPANNNQGYLANTDLYYDTNAGLFGVGTAGVPAAVGDFQAKTFTATGVQPYGGGINSFTLGGGYNQDPNGTVIEYYIYSYKTIAGNNFYSNPYSIQITENFEATLNSVSESYDPSSNYYASGQSFDYTVYMIYGGYYGVYPLDVPFTDTLNDGSQFQVNININPGGGAGLTSPTFIYVNNTNGTYLVSYSTTVSDDGTSWTIGSPSLGSPLTFRLIFNWTNLTFEPVKITASGVGGQTQLQSILVASTGTSQYIYDNNDQWTGDGVVTPTSYTPLGINTNGDGNVTGTLTAGAIAAGLVTIDAGGNLSLPNAGIYDNAHSLGSSGYVLSSTGTQVQWIDISSLTNYWTDNPGIGIYNNTETHVFINSTVDDGSGYALQTPTLSVGGDNNTFLTSNSLEFTSGGLSTFFGNNGSGISLWGNNVNSSDGVIDAKIQSWRMVMGNPYQPYNFFCVQTNQNFNGGYGNWAGGIGFDPFVVYSTAGDGSGVNHVLMGYVNDPPNSSDDGASTVQVMGNPINDTYAQSWFNSSSGYTRIASVDLSGNITGANISGSNLSGTNTGDQTLSGVLSLTGITPVANGTYTVGKALTDITGVDGTITIVGGIITAIQQAT